MAIFRQTFVLLIALVACTEAQRSSGEEQQSTEEQTTSSSQQIDKSVPITQAEMDSAKMLYLIPSPGEIFTALDKLDQVPWGQMPSYESRTAYNDNETRALNLGIRVADAFMAIKAQDASNLGEMNEQIFSMSQEIGLGDALFQRREEIENLVGESKWDELNASLDNVQADVRQEVESMGEGELVVLASIGGWMEGLRAITDYLQNDYSEEKAELLELQDLLSYFNEEFKQMDSDVASHPLVTQTQQAVNEILQVIENKDMVSQEDVSQINQITSNLINTIENHS